MDMDKCTGMEASLADILSETSASFKSLIEDIKMSSDAEHALHSGCAFSLDHFWINLKLSMNALSDSATKLCLAFATDCLNSAKDARPLLSGLENAALNVITTFMSLPTEYGLTLRQFITSSVQGIMESVFSLLTAASQPQQSESRRHLQATGSTWEFSDKLSNLPKDNKEAVGKKAGEALELIGDALQEIESNLEEQLERNDDIYGEDGLGDDAETVNWSEADRLVVTCTVGLLKTSKACAKKAVDVLSCEGLFGSDAIHDAAVVERLDTVAESMSKLSPAVDDLASSLYPPMHLTAVRNACSVLVNAVSSTLISLRSLLQNSQQDLKWIDFLDKAVDHNMNKITQLLNNMQSTN